MWITILQMLVIRQVVPCSWADKRESPVDDGCQCQHDRRSEGNYTLLSLCLHVYFCVHVGLGKIT